MWLMRAARVRFPDGTTHISPGYPTHYDGQWMRDGYYGISNAWDAVNSTHQAGYLRAAEWMFSNARADGIMPQMCPPSGPCQYGQYCNDTVGAPGWRGCQDLDSAGFATKLAYHLWAHLPAPEARARFYRKWGTALLKTMAATTAAPTGLLWSDPKRPMVGYGFKDAEIQVGEVLYSSVLQWNASLCLAEMASQAGDTATARKLSAAAGTIRASATKQLWDGDRGIFRSSSGADGRADVWGSALAGAAGFATAQQAAAVFRFFRDHEADIFYEGQVRETVLGEQWAKSRWISGEYGEWDAPPEDLALAPVYQNGGYWATPHHHVLPFLAMHDRAMACRHLNATIASFRGHGIYEWVGPFFPALSYGAPGYVASAANTYFASEHLRCWERA